MKLTHIIELENHIAEDLTDFEDDSIDVITMAFGIRNVFADRRYLVFKEAQRVLNK